MILLRALALLLLFATPALASKGHVPLPRPNLLRAADIAPIAVANRPMPPAATIDLAQNPFTPTAPEPAPAPTPPPVTAPAPQPPPVTAPNPFAPSQPQPAPPIIVTTPPPPPAPSGLQDIFWAVLSVCTPIVSGALVMLMVAVARRRGVEITPAQQAQAKEAIETLLHAAAAAAQRKSDGSNVAAILKKPPIGATVSPAPAPANPQPAQNELLNRLYQLVEEAQRGKPTPAPNPNNPFRPEARHA